MMGLDDWIAENCFTRSGRLNNRVAIESWWSTPDRAARLREIRLETSSIITDDLTQRIWHVMNGPAPGCGTCGGPTKFLRYGAGYQPYCSRECAWASPDRNDRIGRNRDMPRIMEKTRETCRNRHGVDHAFQRRDVVEKIVGTKLERYGTLNPAIDKIRETCRKRYGSPSWFSSEEGRDHLRDLRRSHGGSLKIPSEVARRVNDTELLREMNLTMPVVEIAASIGVTPRVVCYKLREAGYEIVHHPRRKLLQARVADLVRSYYRGEVVVDDRIQINPRELDIWIPGKRLAIEVNGEYWHGHDERETRDEIYRHWSKLDACRKIGIRLIQLTDRDLATRPLQHEGLIRSALGSFDVTLRASSCDVVDLPVADRIDFFDENHIQGDRGAPRAIGLVHRDHGLVAAISVGKPRFSRHDHEIIRLATKLGFRVHGGATKLFGSLGLRGSVVSYCDMSYFTGGVYQKIGFSLSHETRPGYWYVRGKTRVGRVSAKKHKLRDLLGDDFDPGLSESENMFRAGFVRYWNCGNSVWTKEI